MALCLLWLVPVVLPLNAASGGTVVPPTLLTTFAKPTPVANGYLGTTLTGVGVDRVLIGSAQDSSDALFAGRAYLFKTNGTLLTTFSKPTPVAFDSFGIAVATVGSGHVVIGADQNKAGGLTAGAAFLFSTNGVLVTTFTNPTPADYDRFGASLAPVGSGHVLIGAYDDDIGAVDAGAAYLFSTNGALLTTFTSPNPSGSGYFGYSVAAVGPDRVLIGAHGDNLGASQTGAAYLFNTNGTLLMTFTNPSPASGDQFGYAVSAVGTDRVLIGAPGADLGPADTGVAYLFDTNGTLIVTYSNPTPEFGDSFGSAVASAGSGRILIGANGDNTGAAHAGAAYLFGTNGALIATITNPTPSILDRFGASVAATESGELLVGAPLDSPGVPSAGAAYLFGVSTDTSTAVAPTITTTSTGTTLTLFWPDSATGYRVESTLSFTPTIIWNNVTGTFQTNGGFISIGFPMSGLQKFYRLVKP